MLPHVLKQTDQKLHIQILNLLISSSPSHLLNRKHCRSIMAVRAEGWKSSGLVKGLGIPAPSGPRLVGCVDLMHRLEGREDSLLVRLFYPAAADATGEYARWTPHKRYTKAYMDFVKMRAARLVATLTDIFTGMLIRHFQ